MDFPLVLETCEFVDDVEQLKQSISLILKNVVGSFIQDFRIGALFDVHVFDYAMIHAGVYQSLSILPIEVQSVSVQPPLSEGNTEECRIDVSYIYNNELSTFKNYN